MLSNVFSKNWDISAPRQTYLGRKSYTILIYTCLFIRVSRITSHTSVYWSQTDIWFTHAIYLPWNVSNVDSFIWALYISDLQYFQNGFYFSTRFSITIDVNFLIFTEKAQVVSTKQINWDTCSVALCCLEMWDFQSQFIRLFSTKLRRFTHYYASFNIIFAELWLLNKKMAFTTHML